jgi:hypothetical protein
MPEFFFEEHRCRVLVVATLSMAHRERSDATTSILWSGLLVGPTTCVAPAAERHQKQAHLRVRKNMVVGKSTKEQDQGSSDAGSRGIEDCCWLVPFHASTSRQPLTPLIDGSILTSSDPVKFSTTVGVAARQLLLDQGSKIRFCLAK